MVWPFGSTAPGGGNDDQHSQRATGRRENSGSVLQRIKEWGYVASAGAVGLGALHIYVNYFRRIPSASYIRPSFFRKRSLFGRVTRVGDGDNFHLFHTPGGRFVGWGWLRKVPENRKQLKERTIPVRLAGVDAPEGAHFGRPAQPFSAEALKWLSDYILHRDVRAYIYKRDQYNRAVATVYVRRFLIRRNVGLEMVKRGLATVYEAKSGAEFGGIKDVYEKAEAKAKKKKKGMWSGKASEFESPREYKSRYGSPPAEDR
ncbi:putative endonuclease lcl3 [Lecanicillium sp. MT-2017a]|nr:putative endonuclease lcl3 [Lecanicillium sp. MT-2017a]